jgi:hypothetical protein
VTQDEKSIQEVVREEFRYYMGMFILFGGIAGGLITYIYITSMDNITQVVQKNQEQVNILNNRMVGVERDVKHLIDKVYYKGK